MVYQTNTLNISAMFENNTAAVKVGNEVSSWFCIKSGVKLGCGLSPFIWIILMDFVLRSIGKAMGDHGIKWGGKSLLDFPYPGDILMLNFENFPILLKRVYL